MRSLVITAIAAVALAGVAHAQEVARLRPTITTSGPAVTLGDIFENAGDAAGRAVAPAPPPGQAAPFSAQFVAAAAGAAGLSWSPPEGVNTIVVTRSGGTAARTAAAPARRDAAGAAVVSRGDLVTLVYVAPGLQLTTRARALSSAGLGETVQLVNLQSNQTVEAVVTGPGAASVSPPG
jgi:hypothetical protein